MATTIDDLKYAAQNADLTALQEMLLDPTIQSDPELIVIFQETLRSTKINKHSDIVKAFLSVESLNSVCAIQNGYIDSISGDVYSTLLPYANLYGLNIENLFAPDFLEKLKQNPKILDNDALMLDPIRYISKMPKEQLQPNALSSLEQKITDEFIKVCNSGSQYQLGKIMPVFGSIKTVDQKSVSLGIRSAVEKASVFFLEKLLSDIIEQKCKSSPDLNESERELKTLFDSTLNSNDFRNDLSHQNAWLVSSAANVKLEISSLRAAPIRFTFNTTLDRFVKELEDKDIITKVLADKIIATKDINAKNIEGATALHLCSEKGNLIQVKKLITFGAVHTPDYFLSTPLSYAASNKDPDILKYFLETLNDEQVLSKNSENRNALHVAVRAMQFDNLQILYQDPRIKMHLSEKDLFGRTALDFAIQDQFDKAIQLLSKNHISDPSSLPNYGKSLRRLSQNALNKKLLKYLTVKARDNVNIIDDQGNCSGWAFLYQIYLTAGKENEFYDIMAAIEAWDENNGSLANSDLPASLLENYKSREDLFEQVVNDLNFLQFTTSSSANLKLTGWTQSSREKQYSLIKNASLNRELKTLFSLTEDKFNKQQLIELLNAFSQWPGLSIDIVLVGHSASLYITEDGKFKYFDSNFANRTEPFSNSEDLANTIFNFTIKQLEPLAQDDIEMYFRGYKFYKSHTSIPAVERATRHIPLIVNSPNGFNELHWAILRNDLSSVKEIINRQPYLISQPDSHGVTPLRMASRMQNEDCMLALIMKANKTGGVISQPSLLISFNELENLNSDFIDKLLQHGITDINDVDIFQRTLLHSAIGYERLQIAHQLLADSNWDPNKQDVNGLTPLMAAFLYNAKEDILLKLIEHPRIDLNRSDIYEHTALTYAMQSKTNKNILHKIISQFGINFYHKSLDNKNLLMHAFEFSDDSETIELLLKKHSWNLNDADNKGMNAWMYALRHFQDKTLLLNLLDQQEVNLQQKDLYENDIIAYAIYEPNNFAILQKLLAKKIQDHSVTADYWGNVLTTAIFSNETNIDTMKAIVSTGRVPLNYICDRNMNILMLSIDCNKNIDIINFLLQTHPFDLEHKDSFGRTALMMAVEYGQKEVVAALLLKGANTQVIDDAGRDLHSLARTNQDIMILLETVKSAITKPLQSG